VDLSEIDGVAVTAGPGLMGALVVGLSAAKALVARLDKPLYGLNHLVGHVAVDLLDHGPLPERFGALLVSGGHTSLLVVDDITADITEVGATIDDAAGEAYDKVARLLGMGYPGGPVIDAAAADGDPAADPVPARAHLAPRPGGAPVRLLVLRPEDRCIALGRDAAARRTRGAGERRGRFVPGGGRRCADRQGHGHVCALRPGHAGAGRRRGGQQRGCAGCCRSAPIRQASPSGARGLGCAPTTGP
jgi:hypothetical protein